MFYAAQFVRVVLFTVNARQYDNLVEQNAGSLIDLVRIKPSQARIGFCPGHKHCRVLVHMVKPLEVQIGPIHDIDCPGFLHKVIKDVDIMNLAVRDPDERRDIASKIQ